MVHYVTNNFRAVVLSRYVAIAVEVKVIAATK